MSNQEADLRRFIRDVPDWPKKGILFRDITPLLGEPEAFSAAVDSNVLMVDDLLATGGTMAAACELIEKIGGKIAGIAFLVELSELGGREKLSKYKILTVLKY